MGIDREKARKRRRRIIMNDDSGTIPAKTAVDADGVEHSTDTPEGLLADPLSFAVRIPQVDTVSWCFARIEQYDYDTKVGEIAGREPYPGAPKQDVEHMGTIWRNIKSFLDRGTDPLRTVVEFCHAHGKEVFGSLRMNMIQDSWRPSPYSKWKREHMDLCLGKRGSRQRGDHNTLMPHCWSALDFAHDAVRERRLAIVEEVCAGYDVDGIELDFWRWPILFKPTLDHKPVERRHIDLMTDFMRKTRNRMLEIESDRGTPLMLVPRVFDSPEINLRMGLDVETWLKEGLIDILVVSGSFNDYALPVSDWVALTHAHDVPIYPCMYRQRGLERDRALATYYHSCGSDGIYTFNFRFPHCDRAMQEMGDPRLLAGEDKHYAMNHTARSLPMRNGSVPGLLPVRLEKGTSKSAKLIIGDDVRKAAAEGDLKEIRLRLSLTDFDPYQDGINVKLNGKEMRNSTPVRPDLPRDWDGLAERIHGLEFLVFTRFTDLVIEPNLAVGENRVDVELGPRTSGMTGPVDLIGLELFIRYQ